LETTPRRAPDVTSKPLPNYNYNYRSFPVVQDDDEAPELRQWQGEGNHSNGADKWHYCRSACN